MTSELFYFGLTQKSAPLAIRERLRADRESQVALLSGLSELADGRMVLATCERFEIYASAPCVKRHAWTEFLASWFKLPSAAFAKYVRTLSGPAVAEHLMRVAAGLESRIIGERQILGQVRNAHQIALEQGSLDAQLSVLARTAIRAGKRVRQETALASGCRSIVTLAMDWLSDQQERITGKRVGVVGSGRLAALVVSEVAQRRPGQIVITGRNAIRAGELARRFDARCADLTALSRTLAECEIVFTCTASPVYLVDATLIDDGRRAPLRLIDLCVPRNVDPEVARIPGIVLSHLDEMVTGELSPGRATNAEPAREAVAEADGLVRQELDCFLQWRSERQVAPMISDLLARAASRAIGKRDLHEQIMRLKAEMAI